MSRLIYVLSAELFPTTVRSTGTSIGSFASKIAGILGKEILQCTERNTLKSMSIPIGPI